MKKRKIEVVIYDVDVNNGMRFINEIIWSVREKAWNWFKVFCEKSKVEGLNVKDTVSVRYEDDENYSVLPLTKKLFNKINCVYMTDGEYCYFN